MMTYSLDELKGMVPIYLNGRLPAPEAEAFEAALRRHPELETELKEFSAIKDSYDVLADPPETDADVLFARIQKGIHGERRQTPDLLAQGPVERFMQFLRRIYRTPSLSWSVAGLQFAALLLIFFFVPRQAVFKTYSAHTTGDADRVHLNVVFDKAAKEIEIRALLLKLDAVITSGPSAEGLYVLAVDKTADVEALIRELRASPIVRLAEKKLSQMNPERLQRISPARWKKSAIPWRHGPRWQPWGAHTAA